MLSPSCSGSFIHLISDFCLPDMRSKNIATKKRKLSDCDDADACPDAAHIQKNLMKGVITVPVKESTIEVLKKKPKKKIDTIQSDSKKVVEKIRKRLRYERF
ncbi:hypothetical protein ACS0TY_016417 [Phlomoides rotata]